MVTKRARTWLTRGVVIAVIVVTAALAVATWLYSTEIERELLRWPEDREPPRLLFDGDPSSVGLPFTEVLFAGPLGDHPAWLVAGDGDVWVVMVHGADADRREALRVLPAIAASGHPALVITYRNDGEAPTEDDRHRLGGVEWPDVRAAVEFARREGAREVVLYGFGAGGSVVASFLANEPGGMVAGVVLDAPLLAPGDVVARMAEKDKVPGFLASWSRAMVTFRFGVDWSSVDHVSGAEDFEVPILLIHGEDDERYPAAPSLDFAEAAPDVTLVIVPGAGHGEAWNVDRSRYERQLRDFLARVSVPPEE